MTNLPSGRVTFLFTDVQGSTALWEQQPQRMEPALAEHDRQLRDAVARHGGYVFSTAGDGFGVAFQHPSDALAAATDAQRRLRHSAAGLPLRVRMGIHTGTPTLRDGDYFGPDVNRCARLMAAAHGGQILVSNAAAQLVGSVLPAGVGLRDLGEHRLRDLSERERIHQVVHPDLESEFPPLRTPTDPARDLPAALTSFVGRQEERRAVRELLGTHRLVTLTGAGGAGKTRLAVEVARDAPQEFPDGIRLVELAPLTDVDVFLDELAERVGAHLHPGTPVLDSIENAIERKRFLLVLDNCEHMVEPVADVVHRLLTSCPQLRVLTTSREVLRVNGECTYRVPSLAVPPPGTGPVASLDCDAVRLFVERARLCVPDFALDDSNVTQVISICRRLDGIPLALELAAARLGVMSATEIESRLAERFRLLTNATRAGAGQRHRTLLATIEWSHQLLGEPERVVFRRLSSFVSDVALDAVEHVCAGGEIDRFDVVDVMARLVDKSMVTAERGPGGSTRYQLLETVREYGLDQLHLAGEAASVEMRRLEYYTSLAESLQAAQRAGKLGEALAQLSQEEDHVRAALRFALDDEHLQHAARLVGALGYLWYSAGQYREGIQWCRELFERNPGLSAPLRAAALHSYGTLLGSWTRPEEGADLLREEVDLRRQLGDPARLAAALNNLGNLLLDLGDLASAEVMLVEAIAAFREADQTPALALASLGYGHLHAGEYQRAHELYREALVEATRADDAYAVALATSYLGQCALRTGRITEARDLIEEGRWRFSELNVVPGVSDADLALALVHRADGARIESATRLLAVLSAPDTHWYQDAPYWAIQIAASVIDDQEGAAELIGAVEAGYDRSMVAQPAFFIGDLAERKAILAERLDAATLADAFEAGRRCSQPEAIELAVRSLQTLIASAAARNDGLEDVPA